MIVEPLIALPPRVPVAGRLQCGAARTGVRRGHGECAELAHLAARLHDRFYARHAENGPFSRVVGRNGWLAMCTLREIGGSQPHPAVRDHGDACSESSATWDARCEP